MKFKAAIFDVDGTLVNSMTAIAAGFLLWAVKNRVFIGIKTIKKMRDMTFFESAEYISENHLKNKTPEQIFNEWKNMATNFYSKHIRLRRGVKKYLSYLHENGIKLGIATSSFPEAVEGVLKHNGIWEYFSATSFSDEVGKDKSNPDIYLLCAERLGVEPADCIVFEDIFYSMQGVRGAGMRFVGVYDMMSRKNWGEMQRLSDYSLKSFTQEELLWKIK